MGILSTAMQYGQQEKPDTVLASTLPPSMQNALPDQKKSADTQSMLNTSSTQPTKLEPQPRPTDYGTTTPANGPETTFGGPALGGGGAGGQKPIDSFGNAASSSNNGISTAAKPPATNPNPEPYWNPASSDAFNNSNRVAAGYAPIYTHDPNAPGANETGTAFTDARHKNDTGMGSGTYQATMGYTPEAIARNREIAKNANYTGEFGNGQWVPWANAHGLDPNTGFKLQNGPALGGGGNPKQPIDANGNPLFSGSGPGRILGGAQTGNMQQVPLNGAQRFGIGQPAIQASGDARPPSGPGSLSAFPGRGVGGILSQAQSAGLRPTSANGYTQGNFESSAAQKAWTAQYGDPHRWSPDSGAPMPPIFGDSGPQGLNDRIAVEMRDNGGKSATLDFLRAHPDEFDISQYDAGLGSGKMAYNVTMKNQPVSAGAPESGGGIGPALGGGGPAVGGGSPVAPTVGEPHTGDWNGVSETGQWNNRNNSAPNTTTPTGTGVGSGNGQTSTTTPTPSSGGILSQAQSTGYTAQQTGPVTQWNITPEQTVEGRVQALMKSDNPLIQQARAREIEQWNAHGLANSSMAQTAADSAAYQVALSIAQADAATAAKVAGYNADQSNQNNVTNTAAENRAAEFGAGAANTLTGQKLGAETSIETANIGARSSLANAQLGANTQLALGQMQAGTAANQLAGQERMNAASLTSQQLISANDILARVGMNTANLTSAQTVAAINNLSAQQIAGMNAQSQQIIAQIQAQTSAANQASVNATNIATNKATNETSAANNAANNAQTANTTDAQKRANANQQIGQARESMNARVTAIQNHPTMSKVDKAKAINLEHHNFYNAEKAILTAQQLPSDLPYDFTDLDETDASGNTTTTTNNGNPPRGPENREGN